MNRHCVKYWSWLSAFSLSMAFWAQLVWVITR
ncbi:small membrane protein YmiC [Jejubacter calystegiae]|nr:small membrane protein YmiC [Jejubacter calystegiae]